MTKNDDRPEIPASPPVSVRTPKSIETRARIIEGAIRTLEEHGIGDVTTRRIASAAGVQLATLHYHFDSKEALLLAVLEALNADMIERALRMVAGAGDLDTRIAEIVRASWRHVSGTRGRQIAQIELTLYALRTKGSEWLAARQYRSYIGVYADLLAVGDELPADRRQEIAEALGRFVLCGIDGLILQVFSLQDEAEAEAGLEALVDASRDYLRRLKAGP
ncbi:MULTISPECIES: TetR/AcrR family transcriptional regulator [unclassified Aureimonas]|uniref:TetR/AcrR family transcriptional regulator n=1 Tax=unclassified Aureimonas TaxID=2615206 RepID=UPI0006F7BF31|nr:MULTISPECIES: TetR/AcrR family transcriptional regulator [unclassified Aureimonas]KQT63973.1 hypothetical protein ASG62_02835 [Aureimonas sp. Leaf427]KQT81166.1 hypothetical protein ASG54_00105 [Aureimonas sp. Leaf460]